MENNQCPPSFYNPIIKKCLNDALSENEPDKKDETDQPGDKMFFLRYRGKLSTKFEQSLRKIGAPCKMIFTIKKIKSVLPSIKPSIEKAFKSGVVYQICCLRCQSFYVGQTVWCAFYPSGITCLRVCFSGFFFFAFQVFSTLSSLASCFYCRKYVCI